MGIVGQVARREQQVGLLVAAYVAADGLAEGLGIAVDVQQVVLDLEGQSQVDAMLVERLLLRVRRTGQVGTGPERIRQQHRGLQTYHLDILLELYILALLKIHIQLLSFAYLRGHLVEPPQGTLQFVTWYLCHQLIGFDQHLVARENSRILVPTDMYRLASATHGRMIHDVVVQQGEVMEHLQRQSSRQGLRFLAAKHTAGGQHQLRPYAFTTRRQGISYRLVQSPRIPTPIEFRYLFVDINHFL